MEEDLGGLSHNLFPLLPFSNLVKLRVKQEEWLRLKINVGGNVKAEEKQRWLQPIWQVICSKCLWISSQSLNVKCRWFNYPWLGKGTGGHLWITMPAMNKFILSRNISLFIKTILFYKAKLSKIHLATLMI